MRYLFTLCFLSVLFSGFSVGAQLYRVDSAITTIYHAAPKADIYVKYKYSNGRGSDAVNYQYDCDERLIAEVGGKPINRVLQEYNTSNKITRITYGVYNDTTQQFDRYNDTTINVYDVHNNLVEEQRHSSNRKMWYDGNNNMVKSVYQHFYPASPTIVSTDTLVYNIANQLVYKHTSSNTSVDEAVDSLKYDGSGKLAEHITLQKRQSGIWRVYIKYQFQYNSNGSPSISWSMMYDTTGALLGTWRDSVAYNNNGDIVSRVGQELDPVGGLIDKAMQTYAYNQNGYPIMWRYYVLTPAPAVLHEEVLFFYEQYVRTEGIANRSVLDAILQLYPVPSNGVLNVNVQFKRMQASTIAIYDMQGRMLKQYTAQAAERVSRTILTDDLPAGMYQLVVNGKEGSVAKAFNVVR